MSLLPANLLVMPLLWNNIRFQSETTKSKSAYKVAGTPRDLIEDGISNGKSASVYKSSPPDVKPANPKLTSNLPQSHVFSRFETDRVP